MDGFEDPEQRLLDDDQLEGEDWDAFETSPMFTGDAFDVLGSEVMPQKALYGRVITQHVPQFPSRTMSRKLYINTNTPFSAVVCGVQVSCRLDLRNSSLIYGIGFREESFDFSPSRKLSHMRPSTWEPS